MGNAKTTLKLYGHNLDWNIIRTYLINHFSDKRDERTLYAQLILLKQSGNDVDVFYRGILDIVSLLNMKVCGRDLNEEAKQALIETNQEAGLRSFITGCRDPLRNILKARQPRTLVDAYEIAIDEQRDRPELFNYVTTNYTNRTASHNNARNNTGNRSNGPQGGSRAYNGNNFGQNNGYNNHGQYNRFNHNNSGQNNRFGNDHNHRIFNNNNYGRQIDNTNRNYGFNNQNNRYNQNYNNYPRHNNYNNNSNRVEPKEVDRSTQQRRVDQNRNPNNPFRNRPPIVVEELFTNETNEENFHEMASEPGPA